MSNKIIFDGLEEYLLVLKELEDIARKKGHDYGGDQFIGALESSLGLGVKASLSCLLRADQKWGRVKNLIKNGERTAKVDESIDETVSDMINYLIYVLVFRKKENLETDRIDAREAAWNQSAEGPDRMPATHDKSKDGLPGGAYIHWPKETTRGERLVDVVGEPVFDEDYPENHPRPCPVCTLGGSPVYLLPRHGTKSWFHCTQCRREFNERGQQIVEAAPGWAK